MLRYTLVGLLLFGYALAARAQVPAQLPAVQIRGKVDARTWPDSARLVMQDSLSAARTRWTQARPEQYDLAVLRGSTWMVFENDQRHDGHLRAMRIRGDSIVSIEFERASEYTRWTQWSDLTVDKVFRELEADVADSSRQVSRLEIDPVFGYPTSWETDDARNGYGVYVSDQSWGGKVVLFRISTPNAGRER